MAELVLPDERELVPGYYVEESTGAWLSLPWPDDLTEFVTLGPQVIDWAERYLVNYRTGLPWEFTADQARFVLMAYEVRSDRRWRWRSPVKRGAKGTGKDPLAGVIALAEMLGPVVLDGFDAHGRPVGRPQRMALVQVGANSEDQSKDLLRVANGMVSDDLAYLTGYDAGIKASMAGPDGRSRLEVLVRSERSNEGDPATALILNETHHMTDESGGQALARVGRRNVGKSPDGLARAWEFTNAHVPGSSSVAEETYNAWQTQVAGLTRRLDILYDSREAAPHLRMHVPAELTTGIHQAYADAPWVDEERIADEAEDPRTPAADSIRFYFNALPTNEHAWADPRTWDARAHQVVVEPKSPVALFLDCSKSRDSTALMGCHIPTDHLFTVGLWAKPHGADGTWRVDRSDVDGMLRAQFATYDVQWLGVDPSPATEDDSDALYWAEQLDAWHRDFRDKVLVWAMGNRHSVAFDMRTSTPGGHERNRLFTEQAEMMASDLAERRASWTHDGDPRLRLHVVQARRRPNQWGESLSKETGDSTKLVDLAVSSVGARLGRRLVLNSGKTRQRNNGRVW